MDAGSLAAYAWVALGANLPRGGADPAATLRAVLPELQALAAGPLRVSSFYESDPKDCPPGSPRYVNAVAGFLPQPDETPEGLLGRLQELERRFGRVRTGLVNEPRTLDLDLLVFADARRATPRLILPHPRAHERRFVLEPWQEVVGNDWLLEGRTLAAWLDGCQDPPLLRLPSAD